MPKLKIPDPFIELGLSGYRIGGEAKLNLWGGGTGTMRMEETYLTADQYSEQTVRDSINDGGMGCESIISAKIKIWAIYYNPTLEARAFVLINERTIKL